MKLGFAIKKKTERNKEKQKEKEVENMNAYILKRKLQRLMFPKLCQTKMKGFTKNICPTDFRNNDLFKDTAHSYLPKVKDKLQLD